MPLTYTHTLQTTRAAPQPSSRKMIGIVLVALLHVAMLYVFVNGMKMPALIKQPDPMVLINVPAPPLKQKPIPKPEKHELVDKTLTTEPVDMPQPVIDTQPTVAEPPTISEPVSTDPPTDVSADSAITVKHRVDPTYPAAARRAGEEGTVVLSVMVDPSGRVSAATVLQSSGSTRLDDAALTAIKRWQFAPRSGGTAQVRVPFSFKLEMTRG